MQDIVQGKHLLYHPGNTLTSVCLVIVLYIYICLFSFLSPSFHFFPLKPLTSELQMFMFIPGYPWPPFNHFIHGFPLWKSHESSLNEGFKVLRIWEMPGAPVTKPMGFWWILPPIHSIPLPQIRPDETYGFLGWFSHDLWLYSTSLQSRKGRELPSQKGHFEDLVKKYRHL